MSGTDNAVARHSAPGEPPAQFDHWLAVIALWLLALPLSTPALFSLSVVFWPPEPGVLSVVEILMYFALGIAPFAAAALTYVVRRRRGRRTRLAVPIAFLLGCLAPVLFVIVIAIGFGLGTASST